MSDNPFAEPEDDDRTLIMPRFASRQTERKPAEPAPVAAPVLGAESFGDLAPLGGSPIIAAATPLLCFLCAFRNLASVPDAAALRDRVVAEVKRYEQALREAGLSLEQIRTGHYAICASLDDVVQNTPWGSTGPWADASLVSTFHREVRSGERFFQLLAKLCQNAGKYLPVIELMYLCMSLGMQGRYRLSPRGPAELDRVREETYLIILRQRGASEPPLSLHWRGVAAPFKPLRTVLPLWLTALIAAGLLGFSYALISLSLNADSDRLFEAGLALPPVSMPPISRTVPPAPLPPTPQPRQPRDEIADCLAAIVKQGLVSIVGTGSTPVIRIESKGMFASARATLETRFVPILGRVAACLQPRPGSISVVGYTDNQPIHTVAFPSNFQLSQARARAAAAVLDDTIGGGRIKVEGRADADPIANNATTDGRELNRRIEIVAPRAEKP